MNSDHPPGGTARADAELAAVVAQLRRAMRRTARNSDPADTLSVAQLELLSCLAGCLAGWLAG